MERNTKTLAALAASMLVYACGGGDSEPEAGADKQPDSGAANSAPQISGTPRTLLYEQDQYSFSPQAVDADGDALTFRIKNRPRWATFDAKTGRLSGSPGPEDVGMHRGILITVSDGAAETSIPAFDLRVKAVSHGSFTLSWLPPTENTDDTPLENLDGFNIYWGTAPGEYQNTIRVDNEGVTSYFIDGLDPGTYYFATTAFNSFGTESAVSDPTVIVVR